MRTYRIDLAAGNAATENRILNWIPQTRTRTRRTAMVETHKYRARGFWVRVTCEGCLHGNSSSVYAPYSPGAFLENDAEVAR